MVTLTIKLNKEEIKKADIDEFDENEFWNKIRDYAKKEQINETSNGVFEKDGEDAMALLLKIPVVLLELYEKKYLLKYFEQLELNIDGEIEDCKYCIQEGV